MTGSGSSGSTASSRPARGDLTWLWVTVVAATLTQTSLNLLRPVTSYRLIEIGADETAIGLATAAYAILPLGRLAVALQYIAMIVEGVMGLMGRIPINEVSLMTGTSELAQVQSELELDAELHPDRESTEVALEPGADTASPEQLPRDDQKKGGRA